MFILGLFVWMRKARKKKENGLPVGERCGWEGGGRGGGDRDPIKQTSI
jgi:hypothetical protein